MTDNNNSNNTSLLQYIQNTWGTESPSDVVERIGNGDRLATEALGISQNAKYRSQVVQAGAVDTILAFLLKTDQPFDNILPAAADDDDDDDDDDNNKINIIPCPSVWLNLLNNFCHGDDADGYYLQPLSLAREVQYKILIHMGPLFQDMSNMETRLLFGSRDIWIKSLPFFCNLLYTLLSSSSRQSKNERIGDFLLKQKQLPPFLVQVLFLPLGAPEMAHEIRLFSQTRDDRVPKPDILGTSATFCACAIKTIWTQRRDDDQNATTTLIETYAGILISPNDENNNNDFRLMTGLLPLLLLKTHGDGWYEGGYTAALTLFVILFDKAERLSGPFGVDSAAELLVGIGRHQFTRYAPLARDRWFIENGITGLVTIGCALMTPNLGGRQAPIDYSVAKAIRAGLLDLFVECCDANDPRIATTLEASLRTISLCTILDDTQNALREVAPSVRAKIERIQDRHPLLLPPLMNLKKIIDNPLLQAHPLDDSCCSFCQEQTTPGAIEKCPFCKTIVYCSKDCQRLNWMIHQMDCATRRKDPVSQTPEQLLADGKKIFGLHVSKLLLQASLKGYSALDCIVTIDMCEFTPLLKMYTLDDFSKLYIQDADARTLSEKVLKRNKTAGALTVSFVGFSDTEGFHASLLTFPPDTAPLLPAVVSAVDTEKWIVAQREVVQSSLGGGAAAQMQKNPRLWQAALLKTMKP